MTIKHKEEICTLFLWGLIVVITELGDNKVMKQAVDNVFIDVCTSKSDLIARPSLKTKSNPILSMTVCSTLSDWSSIFSLSCLTDFSVCCGFASYFLYKDFFSGKVMILILCILYWIIWCVMARYYVLCGVDYIINYFLIRDCFLIGSLPSVHLKICYSCCREASIMERPTSVCLLWAVLESPSRFFFLQFISLDTQWPWLPSWVRRKWSTRTRSPSPISSRRAVFCEAILCLARPSRSWKPSERCSKRRTRRSPTNENPFARKGAKNESIGVWFPSLLHKQLTIVIGIKRNAYWSIDWT